MASADDMKQARRGNVEAMHSLALSYKDAGMTDSAFYWAEKAANKGGIASMRNIGYLYYYGGEICRIICKYEKVVKGLFEV